MAALDEHKLYALVGKDASAALMGTLADLRAANCLAELPPGLWKPLKTDGVVFAIFLLGATHKMIARPIVSNVGGSSSSVDVAAAAHRIQVLGL
jgi:hypothetical protein